MRRSWCTGSRAAGAAATGRRRNCVGCSIGSACRRRASWRRRSTRRRSRLSPEPEWLTPTSLDQALALRAERRERATVVAGGTFVGILVNSRLLDPEAFLSLQHVPGLDYVRADDDLRLGALTTHRTVELSPAVREGWPSLAHAFS